VTKAILLLAAGSLLCSFAWAAPPAIRFGAHTIATGLTGGYHVVVADLNRDGKPDVIALADGLSELVWYENPGWQRHVIVSGRSQMINLAATDVDGDGIPELLLADGFDMTPESSEGRVWLLHHNGDPREPWEIRLIDRLPATHRLRVAKMGTHGEMAFINAPLAGPKSVAPDYRDAIELSLYRPGTWKRELINRDIHGVLHGIFIVDWDGDGRDDILTASFEGIHLLRNTAAGWKSSEISHGGESPWPKSGSSDVTVVRTRRGRQLAAIEPWHGNQVSVYLETRGKWQRQVIDSSVEDGHTIVAADFVGNGEQQVVAGFRKGHSLVLYREDGKGVWTRQVIDEHMAAAGCAVADLNGDGRIDLVCIGSATANLVWYENVSGRQ
jgi:hypothetical protein